LNYFRPHKVYFFDIFDIWIGHTTFFELFELNINYIKSSPKTLKMVQVHVKMKKKLKNCDKVFVHKK
jgi:hypothetical protein